MKLTKEQVRHVATLARLEVTPDEEERFAGQLSSVLDYINQLNELDTDSVEPTSHAVDIRNVFREDAAVARFVEGAWEANAPSKDHGHFRVPKIIDN